MKLKSTKHQIPGEIMVWLHVLTSYGTMVHCHNIGHVRNKSPNTFCWKNATCTGGLLNRYHCRVYCFVTVTIFSLLPTTSAILISTFEMEYLFCDVIIKNISFFPGKVQKLPSFSNHPQLEIVWMLSNRSAILTRSKR